jgi:hypothetical protein
LSKTYRHAKTGATRKTRGTLGYPWALVTEPAPKPAPVKPARVTTKPAGSATAQPAVSPLEAEARDDE